MDQYSNTVTLQADDAECNTLNGDPMAEYNAFKIDMGFREESFRSSDQLETFHLGVVREDLSEPAEPSSNPWLASEWYALVPRTMVTLVFEDGSEGHYAQNEAQPDEEDDDDDDSDEEDDDDDMFRKSRTI